MRQSIRQGRPSDLDALVAIENGVFSADRISPASFRRFLRAASADVLVAETEGRVAGYAVLLRRADTSGIRIYSIAVASFARKLGIGSALIDAAEAVARASGAGDLRLEVREDNPGAISLYERNGFRPRGLKRNYYADGATALRYLKPLADPDGGQ